MTTAKEIRARCIRIIREADDFIRTVESWNQNRKDTPPLDCEPERVVLPIAEACLAALEAGNYAEAEVLSGRMVEVYGGIP